MRVSRSRSFQAFIYDNRQCIIPILLGILVITSPNVFASAGISFGTPTAFAPGQNILTMIFGIVVNYVGPILGVVLIALGLFKLSQRDMFQGVASLSIGAIFLFLKPLIEKMAIMTLIQ